MDNPASIDAYAAALWHMGRAAGSAARVEQELPGVLDLLDRSPELAAFLADRGVTDTGKEEALRRVLAEQVDPVLLHFLLVLNAEHEWHRLRAIMARCLEQAAAERQAVAGEVRSAVPLAEADLGRLEQALRARVGRPVRLQQRVDPRLLGGVAVRMGDEVIDGTVAGRLESIREALLA